MQWPQRSRRNIPSELRWINRRVSFGHCYPHLIDINSLQDENSVAFLDHVRVNRWDTVEWLSVSVEMDCPSTEMKEMTIFVTSFVRFFEWLCLSESNNRIQIIFVDDSERTCAMFTLDQFLENTTWNPTLDDAGVPGKKILHMRLQVKPGITAEKMKIDLNGHDLRINFENKGQVLCRNQATIDTDRSWFPL